MAVKVIYFFDATTKQFDHSELVDSSVTIPENATDIRPADGLYTPLTFNGTEWTGSTREAWLAAQPAPVAPVAPTPTAEQLMINSLGQQVAALTAKLATQSGGAK